MIIFDNRHRYEVTNEVTNALQRLADDPGRLSRERARYDHSPPSYSSGETTQPPSPTEGPTDDEVALQARREAMFRSLPYRQFQSQTHREMERFTWQQVREWSGRRQTLPYDDTADFLANSENNVRARWVEQGIWKEEWGPAWPKRAKPSDNFWRYSSANSGGPRPCGRWLHEKRSDPKLPSPEPAPEPKAKNTRHIYGNIFGALEREEPNTTPDKPDVTETPAATAERDTSASRPYRQFRFQVSKEREWIRDELQYKQSAETIDIDAMAYQSTKNNWIEDEIWNPVWGELPGTTWLHEDLEDEDERRISESQPDAVSNDEQPSRLPSPRPSSPELTSGVYNDDTNSNHSPNVPEEIDAPKEMITKARIQGKSTNGTSQLSTIKKGPRSAAKSADRAFRRVRSSKVMKPSGSRSKRQSNTRTKNATLQSPSAGILNNTSQTRATVEDQPIAPNVPRRSKRIAAYPS